MGITVENIKDNEYFEYKGDVHVTGDIGENATIIIKDGSLTVDGDVKDRAQISLGGEQNANVVIGTMFLNGVSISGNATFMTVHGNVGEKVKIETAPSDVTIDGNVGNHTKINTKSGDITTSNVGNNVTLKTMSGDIQTANVGRDSILKTMSGDVQAENVDQDSSVETMSGDVRVKQANESVDIKTMSGDIYKNGVRQRNPNQHHSGASVSIGGMSVFSGGRIIVNGRDITDLVNQDHNVNSSVLHQPPVRYMK